MNLGEVLRGHPCVSGSYACQVPGKVGPIVIKTPLHFGGIMTRLEYNQIMPVFRLLSLLTT
jgi:hypothetical protein